MALITSKLQESLEASFQEGLMQDQSDLVLRCLRTYALIDKTSHAEELFKHTIVKPFMEDVISEKTYNSEGLEEICRKVLNFVSKQCKMLVNLTSENHSQNGRDHTVKGFDFLVNSVWPEVDNGFESRLPFIFSPGNPDAFFEVR